MARFMATTIGKNHRRNYFDDIGKFRAYMRRKAKQGFFLTRFEMFFQDGEYKYWAVIECNAPFPEDVVGQMCLGRADTPGYQKVQAPSLYRPKGVTMWYHRRSHHRPDAE